ncbi:sensor histidine kinase [Devosia sp.]|uniref:sensor histidine kinase n=1 Tax=Devosia sp. TaxID=1871048 RepID=UPI002FCABFE6
MASWRDFIGKAGALAIFVVLLLLPFAIRLPEPDALRIERAVFSLNDGAAEEVMLPHSWPRTPAPGAAQGEYRITFKALPEQDGSQLLLIPLSRLDLRVILNGRELHIDRASAWASPLVNTAGLVRLPPDVLAKGENVLSIRLDRKSGLRLGYLSKLYAGDADQILPNYHLRAFFADQLRMMILALAVLIAVGVTALYLIRRQDVIFGWFALLAGGGVLINLVELGPFHLLSDPMRAILVVALTNFTSISMIGVAFAAAERQLPRWLIPLIVVWPTVVFASLASMPSLPILIGLFGLVPLAWLLAAIVILVRAFRDTRNVENALLAAALVIIIWYGLIDFATITGMYDRGFLLLPYPQPLLIAAGAFILIHRLAISLHKIDIANDTLRVRLTERESELAEAHAQERALTAGIAREQERQRLMRDLHDGLSGHIVSIIALAERAENRDIEQAARESLDDLRLVIQSLDIDGEDIPVVLAYFRERASPQLRRIGIALDWSMDRIPVITGVTPGHALSLLRILQEAVTNAIKHGPARRIAINGTTSQMGSAIITVANDGRNILSRVEGNGFRNMHRRAESLGGNLTVAPTSNGMCLTLELPPSLPTLAS